MGILRGLVEVETVHRGSKLLQLLFAGMTGSSVPQLKRWIGRYMVGREGNDVGALIPSVQKIETLPYTGGIDIEALTFDDHSRPSGTNAAAAVYKFAVRYEIGATRR